MQRKDLSQKKFVVFIMAELFARDLNEAVKKKFISSCSVETIYNGVHCCWTHDRYKDEIFKEVAKVLKNEYNLDFEELKSMALKEKEI